MESRRCAIALKNIASCFTFLFFYSKRGKHTQYSAEILKANVDLLVLKVCNPVLQTSINVLGLKKTTLGVRKQQNLFNLEWI